MKKLLSLKIPVSALLFILLIFSILAILFGSIVKQAVQHRLKLESRNQPQHETSIYSIAESVASIPYHAKVIIENILRGDAITGEMKEFSVDTYSNKTTGLSFSRTDKDDLDGYLLISQYHKMDLRSKVHLIDIDRKIVVHTWSPDIDTINKQSKIYKNIVDIKGDFSSRRYPFLHPLLLQDGSLVFNGEGSPLVKVDKCSNLAWQIDKMYHHAIELEDNGPYLWASSRNIPGKFRVLHKEYHDDAIDKIDVKNGEVVFSKSVTEILFDNNLEYLMNTAYLDYDPIHLNDIQCAEIKSDYWEKGDLFLSLRNISTILLYRPSTNKVIWFKQGPWTLQHDIDIIDGSTIGIFNNNNIIHDEINSVTVYSQIIFFDLKHNIPTRPYKKLLNQQKIRSLTGSLFTIVKGGDIVIEETVHSRVIRGDKEGNIKWQYIWDAIINWSRYITDQEFAETAFMNDGTTCQN
jgi:hypothetical protein